jgi:hypothetical protein
MKEIVTLRVARHDGYPAPASLLPLARDTGSHLDFELASDHPRWGEIVAYCARLAEWKRNEREVEARLGVPIPTPLLHAVAGVVRESEREARERGWEKPPDREGSTRGGVPAPPSSGLSASTRCGSISLLPLSLSRGTTAPSWTRWSRSQGSKYHSLESRR